MMRALSAVGAVLLSWGCSEKSTPTATGHASEPPPAVVSATPPPVATIAAPSFEIRREGGFVSAAEAERVLHVGDSMVPLVGNYLRKVVWSKGRKYYIQSVASSSSLDWGQK